MTEIEWADPPAPQGGTLTRREQRDFAEKLKAQPGCWAVFPTSGGSGVAVRALASRISRGKQAAFSSGFEAVFRDGTVYVRYVGVA